MKFSISQNFIVNELLVKRLLDLSSISRDDLVYEIGSGRGIITNELAKYCKKVVAVEIDPVLYKELETKLNQVSNVDLKNTDFLDLGLPKEPYKVFSNIPFNKTAAIFNKLLRAENPPEDSYLVIQKEAATKYLGLPFGKETQTSAMLRPWFSFKVTYQFKKSDFKPVPKVNVVFLSITKRHPPLVNTDHSDLYRDFITYSFNTWKPNLVEGLSKVFTKNQLETLAKSLKFSLKAKPSDLNIEQWLGLFNSFLLVVDNEKKTLISGSYLRLRHQQEKLVKINRTRLAKDWRRAVV